MLSDGSQLQTGHVWGAGKDRVRIGPVPAWAVQLAIPAEFKSPAAGHVSSLLWSRQRHARLRQEFVHDAVRLESALAVERHSPWRLEFDPRREEVVLHWIKTHRAGVVTEHARLENLRMTPREGGGSDLCMTTMSLLLEDVRPGDILEWCYTIEGPEGAGNCAALYQPPTGGAIGKLHISVRFERERPLRWKASTGLVPYETAEDGETIWSWARNEFAQPALEDSAPDGYLYGGWVQISDYSGWGSIGAWFARMWKEERVDPGVTSVVREIAAAQPDPKAQPARALRAIDAQFRRLEEDEPLDSRLPAPPGETVRRALGSNRDLAFLFWHLLKQLGLPTRMILVNTRIGRSLPEMLPMPGVFNRVVVEFDTPMGIRWADPAARNRAWHDYGFGLPVVAEANGLIAAPPPGSSDGQCDVVETLLLDTTGANSLLGVVVKARGLHAEELRNQFETEGATGAARARLESCARRFSDARRVTDLQYSDRPESNEFHIAETFAIGGFLRPDAKAGWHRLELMSGYIADFLKLPDTEKRTLPFALPYPCRVSHTFEIHCLALSPAAPLERTVETPWLRFERRRTTMAGCWILHSSLETLAAAVPADRLEEHCAALQDIRGHCLAQLSVPAGQPRPHPRSDFAKLPQAPAPRAQAAIVSEAPASSTPSQGTVRMKRRKRHRRHRHEKRDLVWQIVLGALLAVAFIVFVVNLVKEQKSTNPPPSQFPPPQLSR